MPNRKEVRVNAFAKRVLWHFSRAPHLPSDKLCCQEARTHSKEVSFSLLSSVLPRCLLIFHCLPESFRHHVVQFPHAARTNVTAVNEFALRFGLAHRRPALAAHVEQRHFVRASMSFLQNWHRYPQIVSSPSHKS
jgi:hypothetical protein